MKCRFGESAQSLYIEFTSTMIIKYRDILACSVLERNSVIIVKHGVLVRFVNHTKSAMRD